MESPAITSNNSVFLNSLKFQSQRILHGYEIVRSLHLITFGSANKHHIIEKANNHREDQAKNK